MLEFSTIVSRVGVGDWRLPPLPISFTKGRLTRSLDLFYLLLSILRLIQDKTLVDYHVFPLPQTLSYLVRKTDFIVQTGSDSSFDRIKHFRTAYPQLSVSIFDSTESDLSQCSQAYMRQPDLSGKRLVEGR